MLVSQTCKCVFFVIIISHSPLSIAISLMPFRLKAVKLSKRGGHVTMSSQEYSLNVCLCKEP